MTNPTTILKKAPEKKDMQYSFLRETGREYIESLAHRLWTDYNTHDPGITILEMLAYSITDLGYRLNFPIKDIVSYPSEEEVKSSPSAAWKMHNQFLSALHALPACPLTALDYRKLFIDVEGVRNAWLFKNTDKEHKLWIDCKESKLQYEPPVAGRPSIEVNLNGFYDV